MSAWSVLDTLPFECSAAGQTAPDGVAGDTTCVDPGGLTGRNAGLGWEGHGFSTCYLLGSVLLSPAAFSHSWGPDWTAMGEIKGLRATSFIGEGNSHAITYTRTMCFSSHLSQWTKHTNVYMDAILLYFSRAVFVNELKYGTLKCICIHHGKPRTELLLAGCAAECG